MPLLYYRRPVQSTLVHPLAPLHQQANDVPIRFARFGMLDKYLFHTLPSASFKQRQTNR
jgi:hypothetical protein